MDGQSKQYRYVRVEDLALAANDVVEYADATGMKVSQDRAGGSSLGRSFAGVALNTVTDAYYTWVQVKGVATCKVAAGAAAGATVAAGARVVTHATSNGAVATATTSTEAQAFGTALSADTATTSAAGTVSVMLDL
ncbi:MAG: hypothetical protein K0U38_01500 [Epsilonproteobacteria bacterium]|nr:hypothetical protein [Campylobacterota bacterium]